MGTVPAYGQRGGALTVVDPAASTWKVHRDLVPGHAVWGLTTGAGHAHVGTSVEGDGFIAPAAGDAQLLVCAAPGVEILEDHVVPGARDLAAMGHARGRTWLWPFDHAGGQRLWCDAAGTVHAADGGDWRPQRAPMVTDPGGRLAFGARDPAGTAAVLVLDPASGALEVLWRGGADDSVVLAADAAGLWLSRGRDLCQLRQREA